jgi:hypothetical protein
VQRNDPSPNLLPDSHGTGPEFQLGNLPQIQETNIGDGLQGNKETIAVMKQVARIRSRDPLPRKLASNILLQYSVASHDFIGEALAIGDYVKQKVRYLRDPEDVEYLQDPIDLIKNIQNGTAQGDCDDMALLTATLLLSIGHQPFYRAVRYDQDSGNYNHIYVVVYEQNQGEPVTRIVLDCILKDRPIGSEVSQVNGDEYEC